ncbi:hypothetical protein RQN30_11350 [Arcanobacterium hippocoleae]
MLRKGMLIAESVRFLDLAASFTQFAFPAAAIADTADYRFNLILMRPADTTADWLAYGSFSFGTAALRRKSHKV